MADPVMSNLLLRRVLECVTERYQTAEQISSLYSKKYPVSDIDLFLKASNFLRRKVFSEKTTKYKVENLEKEISILCSHGYVEKWLTNFYLEVLPRETKFYRLTDLGRSLLFSYKKKK